MERGEEILRGVVRANNERLAQFEDKLCEGITALSLLVEIPARNGSITHWLNEVWQLLNTQESTRPLAIYLAASLTVVDRMFLFDAVLSRLTEPDLDSPAESPSTTSG